MSFALPLLATAGLFHFLLEVGEDDSGLGIRLSSFRRNARRMLACLSDLPGSRRRWGRLCGVAVVQCITMGTVGLSVVSRRPVEALSLPVLLAGDWLSSNSLTL